MKLDTHTLLRAFAVCALSATVASSAAPYDFTGQWTGTASSRGVSVPLEVDFVPTGNPRAFTGTSTFGVPQQSGYVTCSLTAKYTRKLKVRLICSDGTKPHVTAQLYAATQTLTGSFPFVGKHGTRHTATFTLMRTGG
jgi:hypothetical protein